MQNAVSSDVLTTPATIANTYSYQSKNSYQSKKLGVGALWLAIITALVFLLSFSSGAKAQVPSCSYDPCPETQFDGTYGFYYIYPGFPTCSLYVRYQRKKCPAPSYKWSFKIIEILCPNNSACSTFKAWINSDDANYQQVFEFASEAISKIQLFTFDFPDYLTNSAAWCPYGESVSETFFAGCNHYCVYEDNRPPISGGTGYDYIVPMDCGAYGKCCLATITTCYDTYFHMVVSTITKVSIGSGISCPFLLTEICPSTHTIDNAPVVGGTYNLPFTKSTSGCIPNSCD